MIYEAPVATTSFWEDVVAPSNGGAFDVPEETIEP